MTSSRWCYPALLIAFFLGAILSSAAQTPDQAPSSESLKTSSDSQNQPSSTSKPKKVWTNDELPATPSDGNKPAPVRNSITKKPPANPPNPALVQSYRTRIEKLQKQLSDTDSQLTALKQFLSGETNGSSARDWTKGVNRTPVPQQIQKLEEKKKNLQAQLDAAYDEARHNGIASSQLP